MNPLVRHILADLGDDMVDVGLKKWLIMTLGFGLLWWATWGMGWVLNMVAFVMFANLLGASLATFYWQLESDGRHPHGS